VVKQSRIPEIAIVSPLYAVYEPISFEIGVILDAYFKSPDRAIRYLTPLVHKGAKNTINVTDAQFLEGRLAIPMSKEDQEKLANALLCLLDEGAIVSALTTAYERKNNMLWHSSSGAAANKHYMQTRPSERARVRNI
jgi:type I restriction enzyme S subunit